MRGSGAKYALPRSTSLSPSKIRQYRFPRAGTGTDRGYSFLLSGDNDGTVRVEETRLEGAKDFLVVPRLHTFIMNAREVIDAAIRFLETGRFRAEPA